jgi:hypothetical protein
LFLTKKIVNSQGTATQWATRTVREYPSDICLIGIPSFEANSLFLVFYARPGVGLLLSDATSPSGRALKLLKEITFLALLLRGGVIIDFIRPPSIPGSKSHYLT